MKKHLALAAITLLIVTGCESSKKDVVAKDYVLIVHNISSMACSFVGMSIFKEKYGLENREVLYHEDADNTINCDDYGHVKDKTCWEETITDGSDACAIGIDEADEPDTSGKDDVKKETFVAIIPHVSTLACTKGGIDKVLEDYGHGDSDYTFTQETSSVTCADFPGTTCKTFKGLEEDEAGYSKDFSCVIGTSDKALEEAD
jgi:hypothetical protein